MRVEVAYSPAAGVCERESLQLPLGSTLLQALLASTLLPRHGLQPGEVDAGVWGRRRSLSCVLCEHDRVEIYRPLRHDPKQARRERLKAKPAGAGRANAIGSARGGAGNTGQRAAKVPGK